MESNTIGADGSFSEEESMKYYNEINNELRDEKIVSALKQCAVDYENGAILEVCNELADIVNAILAFEEQTDETILSRIRQ